MATLNICVTVNSADAREFAAAGQPNRCVGNASRLLDALASGSRPGSVEGSTPLPPALVALMTGGS